VQPTEKEIEKRTAEVMEFLSKVDIHTARYLVLENGPVDQWRRKVHRDYKVTRGIEAKQHLKTHNLKVGSKVGVLIPAEGYWPKRYVAGKITDIRRTQATIEGIDNAGRVGSWNVDIVWLLPV